MFKNQKSFQLIIKTRRIESVTESEPFSGGVCPFPLVSPSFIAINSNMCCDLWTELERLYTRNIEAKDLDPKLLEYLRQKSALIGKNLESIDRSDCHKPAQPLNTGLSPPSNPVPVIQNSAPPQWQSQQMGSQQMGGHPGWTNFNMRPPHPPVQYPPVPTRQI